MVLNKSKRVIALGFFDGVHRGHGALLERVVEKSRELGAVASAFTFDRSPTAAITGQVVPRGGPGVAHAHLLRHSGGHRLQL